MARINQPSLWQHLIPVPDADSHKYSRGCAVIFAGSKMTGAARLAAASCARVGAGLVVCVAPEGSGDIYRISLPAHIIVEDFAKTSDHLNDARRNVALIGPGAGADKKKVLNILETQKPCVLDADALTAFEGKPKELLEQLHPRCVLTPHEGEFKKLFPDIGGSPLERAEKASARSGCTILLKGNMSVITAPEKEALFHDEPAPYLATAGSGDVLAGMITGFLAQGMEPFDATAASVYLHRAMGQFYGAGLVASDLPDLIPYVLKDFTDGEDE